MSNGKRRGRPPRNPPLKCPRCGEYGYRYIESRGNRLYIYYRHPGRRNCYIGPLEGYEYVERLHQLSLSNLEELDYVALAGRIVGYMSMRGQYDEMIELAESIYRHLPPEYRESFRKIVEKS
ncbi:MAG: hypothetical protein QXT27_01870 [Pyrobaculum sp.]